MRPLDLKPSRRIPWGVIGMIGLVAAGESFLARNEVDFGATTTSCEWRAIGEAIPSKVAGSEILCFGDSLMKMAISPPLLEQRTGRKAYNLAVSGGRAPSSYILLRRALDSGVKPAAILVDFKWSALETTVVAAKRTLPDIAGPRDHLDLALSLRDAGLFADLMTAEALPSYRCRLEVRASVMAALEGKSKSLREMLKPWYRSWDFNRGSHHVPSTPEFNGNVDTTDLNVFRDPWTCDPVNVRYVDRFLRLARDRGIPVYWLITPISPNAQAWRDQHGPDAAYSAFVRKFQARYPTLTVVDGRKSGYSAAACFDATHLNRRGTAAFTAEVANLVRRRLGGDDLAARWVNLPPFREPGENGPFEDVTQSAIALQELAKTSRR